MTTLDAVAKKKTESSAEELAAAELVRMAKEQGLSLTGPNGLLNWSTTLPPNHAAIPQTRFCLPIDRARCSECLGVASWLIGIRCDRQAVGVVEAAVAESTSAAPTVVGVLFRVLASKPDTTTAGPV